MSSPGAGGSEHERLWRESRQGDPAAATNSQAGYQRTAVALNKISETIQAPLKEFGLAWEGAAAGAANRGIGQHGQWAGEAAARSTAEGAKAGEYARSAQDVKHKMPPYPPQLSPSAQEKGVMGGNWALAEEERMNALQRARQLMADHVGTCQSVRPSPGFAGPAPGVRGAPPPPGGRSGGPGTRAGSPVAPGGAGSPGVTGTRLGGPAARASVPGAPRPAGAEPAGRLGPGVAAGAGYRQNRSGSGVVPASAAGAVGRGGQSERPRGDTRPAVAPSGPAGRTESNERRLPVVSGPPVRPELAGVHRNAAPHRPLQPRGNRQASTDNAISAGQPGAGGAGGAGGGEQSGSGGPAPAQPGSGIPGTGLPGSGVPGSGMPGGVPPPVLGAGGWSEAEADRHERPGYLLDDSDLFPDEDGVVPPVIGR